MMLSIILQSTVKILGTASRKHLRTKVTPDLHLTYSKSGGNLGLVLNDKKGKLLHKIICCVNLLESPRGGDSNRSQQHVKIRKTNDNYTKKYLRIWSTLKVLWVRRCSRNGVICLKSLENNSILVCFRGRDLCLVEAN